MKKSIHYAVCLAAITLIAISCSKTGNTAINFHRDASIMGKWRLVSDSSWQGIGPYVDLSVNAGTTDDYWDFRLDGRVYVQEGSKKDTLTYHVNSGNSITIQHFGWILNGQQSSSTIRVLTAHQAIIESNSLQAPGGVNFRKLLLSR